MKRKIIQTKTFEKEISSLIEKKKVLVDDFEDFKKTLIENPGKGDVIPGSGGIRKARLKSASKGTRGGFRICYLNLGDKLVLFLLFIYSKSDKENLSHSEKNELKQIVKAIKGGDHHE